MELQTTIVAMANLFQHYKGRNRMHSGRRYVNHRGQSSRLGEREREHRERIKVLNAQLQRVEAQSDEYRLQIENMAQINQRLARQGLPLPHGDDYFSKEFGHLWSDIGNWAKLASRRQDPITIEIWKGLSAETHATVSRAFENLQELLTTKPSRSLRTRFIELIIFKNLQAWMFGKHVLGLSERIDEKLGKLWQAMIAGESTTGMCDP